LEGNVDEERDQPPSNMIGTVRFSKERDTKNMVRFSEVVPEGAAPLVGTVYLRKDAAKNYTDIEISITGCK
jgi:hypothetical protein